jgi:hypothetical protein
LVPGPWTAPTFQNSWKNYGAPFQTAGYRKVGDVVQLRGLINGGAQPTIAFTLPAGYLPPAVVVACAVADGATTNGRVDIGPTGTVTMQNGMSGTAGFISLEGIQFSTSAT